MIRSVVFDFDGTLVNSNRIKRSAAYEVVNHVAGGREILDRVYAEQPDGNRYSIFNRFAHLATKEVKCSQLVAQWGSELAAEYTSRCEDAVARCDEIPGSWSILNFLKKKKFLLAINSATPTYTLRGILEQRGWRKVFDEVLGAPNSKADNLNIVARNLEVCRYEMVMVGDKVADQAGAYAFGCPFIAFRQPDSDFSGSLQFEISEMNQLFAVIQQININLKLND